MTVADLVAKQGIATALALHSRGVDRADANLLGAAYHPDATVDYGFFVGAAATFVDILSGAQKTAPLSLHRTGNIWIKAAGDRAVSESYVIAHAASLGDDPRQRLIGGRYLDRHERRNGEWRLAHRTYVLDWNTNRPSTATSADPPVSSAAYLPSGGHGAGDAGRALLTLHATRHCSKGPAAMSLDPSTAAIGAALAKQALHELSTGYARGVDRADEPLLASLFHDDAIVISGIANGKGAEFARRIVEFVTTKTESCFHSVANEWFEVTGDHAIGESYVIAMMAAAGREIMTGGRYIDSFERRDAVWKFSSRTFVVDWTTDAPASGETGGMFESLKTRGCFGRGDPVYAHWAAQ